MNFNQRPGLLNLSKFSLIEALLPAYLCKPPAVMGNASRRLDSYTLGEKVGTQVWAVLAM